MRTSRGVALRPPLCGPEMRAGGRFGQQGARLAGLYSLEAVDEKRGRREKAHPNVACWPPV